MSQDPVVGDLDRSIGYVLKQASAALRASMDDVLRPFGLSVPQYACLELLGQRPGQSNAELARGAFVTRQSMNEVLRGLQERGLLERPDMVAAGRSRPTRLTADGRRLLKSASAAVARVEERMLAALASAQRERLLRDLLDCSAALTRPERRPDRLGIG